MNTLYGWIGLVILLFNYLLVIKTNKYFFQVGVLSCVAYIIHSILTQDDSILFVNIFLLIINLIKIKQNQNI